MRHDRAIGGGSASRRDILKLAAFLGVSLVAPVPAAFGAAPDSWSPTSRALVAEVAQIVIPVTDTGGAKEAGVPAFIEMMVGAWFEADERANFFAGMTAFADGAAAKHGTAFVDLAAAEKEAWFAEQLTAGEAALAAAGAKGVKQRSPFAVLMKRLTIYGYYTSELGSSVELSLNLVPNEFLPDAPLQPGDRADSFILYSLSPLSAF